MNPFFLGALVGLIAGVLLWLLPFSKGKEVESDAESQAEAERLKAEIEEHRRELKEAREREAQQTRKIQELGRASEESERLARRVRDLESLEARIPGLEADARQAADLRAELGEMKARSEQAHWQFEAAKAEQNRLRDDLDRALAEAQASKAAGHQSREALERRIRELEAEAILQRAPIAPAAAVPAGSGPAEPLEQINGIGMLLRNKLNEAGIMSFRDLAEAPRTRLQELLGRADDAEAIQAEAARRAEGEPR